MSGSSNENSCGEFFLIILLIIGYIFFGDGCGGNSSASFLKKECSYCSATGKRDCSRCYGDGKERCSTCSGVGTQHRYDYGYDNSNGGKYHYYYGQFPCKKCSQTGKVDCSNYSCEYGKEKCSYCNGDGYK
jgi:hypothetical protein